MPTQKTYKIAQLSLLHSHNPAIEYHYGNKEFNTIEEAHAEKPKDNRNAIYLVIELSNLGNNLKSAKIIQP